MKKVLLASAVIVGLGVAARAQMRVILLAAILLIPGAAAFAADISATLTAGTVTPVLQSATAARGYERFINVGTSGTAWCSRYDRAPAPNKPGSFPLAPFGNSLGLPSTEEFNAPGVVPQLPLWCTADFGTVTLTGEVLP